MVVVKPTLGNHLTYIRTCTLQQVKIVEFDEPDGWVDISVLDSNER